MITIWHNPRCSKSRQTLALLIDKGIKVDTVEYLKIAPTTYEIKSVLEKLAIAPIDMMRTKEAAFKDLGLSGDASDALLIEAMATHPVLIERPIVITETKAAIGRPPEAVMAIL